MSSYLLVERKGVALGKTFLVSDDRDEKLIGKLKFSSKVSHFWGSVQLLAQTSCPLTYFFDATGKLVSNHKRSYDIRKDFVDWIVELQLLTERPSAFKNSSFGKIIPSDIYSYLFQLTAPKRKIIFSAVSQRLNNGEPTGRTRQSLTNPFFLT